jgi:hypothetical protein
MLDFVFSASKHNSTSLEYEFQEMALTPSCKGLRVDLVDKILKALIPHGKRTLGYRDYNQLLAFVTLIHSKLHHITLMAIKMHMTLRSSTMLTWTCDKRELV